MVENKNIVIASKSEIISQGICTLLLAVDSNLQIQFASSFEELEHCLNKHECRVVFISNRLIVNQDAELSQLKQKYLVYWIGVVVDAGTRDIQHQFDAVVYLDDSSQVIKQVLDLSIAGEVVDVQSGFDKSMLSDRELDVLKLLVEGFSNKEIANRLFISTHTVISHRKNISQKTGIKSVSGLTIFAVLNKLVTVDNYF